MTTRFLVSVPSERSDGRWTTGRVPVVPCLPPQHDAAFLCVGEWKLAHEAEVADVDIDPDALADEMSREYPGIPRSMHEAYIMGTFKAASGMAAGTRLRIRVEQNSAVLVASESGATTVMWESKPGVAGCAGAD